MRLQKFQSILLVTLGVLAIGLIYWQQSEAATLGNTTTATSVSLATNKQQYAPGEMVLISVTNHGRSPIDFSADPAFRILQGEQMIYTPVAALGAKNTAARTLGFNEQATWTWDQFSLSGQIPSGDYLVVAEYQVGNRTERISTTITVAGAER